MTDRVPGLDYIDREFASFSSSAGWLDLKRFVLRGDVRSTTHALELLLTHVRYRDTYISFDSHEQDSGHIHGPYELQHVSSASFDPVSAEAAVRAVTYVAEEYCDSPDTAGPRLSELGVISLIHEMPSRLLLQDLGEGARWDCGWILAEFTELVLIDLSTHALVLIVAASD
jgi:hypothetical protein